MKFNGVSIIRIANWFLSHVQGSGNKVRSVIEKPPLALLARSVSWLHCAPGTFMELVLPCSVVTPYGAGRKLLQALSMPLTFSRWPWLLLRKESRNGGISFHLWWTQTWIWKHSSLLSQRRKCLPVHSGFLAPSLHQWWHLSSVSSFSPATHTLSFHLQTLAYLLSSGLLHLWPSIIRPHVNRSSVEPAWYSLGLFSYLPFSLKKILICLYIY